LPSELSGVLVILVVLVELSRILTVVIELPGMLIVAILEGVLIAVTAPRSLKTPTYHCGSKSRASIYFLAVGLIRS
jgi:hypothetical protein